MLEREYIWCEGGGMKTLTTRQTNVVLLRRSGASFVYIGEKLGVTRSRAARIYADSESKLLRGSHCMSTIP